MSDSDAMDLTPEEEKITGALQVVSEGGQRMLRVGDASIPLPRVDSPPSAMDSFNRFLAQTQLGTIERKKQRRLRNIVADAEAAVLTARTDAIIRAHQGVAAEALAEIIIAANQFGREALRRDQLAEQANVQRAVLQAAIQYSEFVKDVPEALPDGVREDVLKNALEVYKNTLERIRNTKFDVNVDS